MLFLVQYALLQAGCFDGLFSPVIVNIDDQHFLYSFWHCQLRAGFAAHFYTFAFSQSICRKLRYARIFVHYDTCNAFQLQWLLPNSLSCTSVLHEIVNYFVESDNQSDTHHPSTFIGLIFLSVSTRQGNINFYRHILHFWKLDVCEYISDKHHSLAVFRLNALQLIYTTILLC